MHNMKRQLKPRPHTDENRSKCAFEGKNPGSRKIAASELFNSTFTKIFNSVENTREYFDAMHNNESYRLPPSESFEKKQNEVTLTVYTEDYGMRLGCSEHICPLDPSKKFFHLPCTVEPINLVCAGSENKAIKKAKRAEEKNGKCVEENKDKPVENGKK